MYDYPGLSSREVVEARKVLKSNDFDKIIIYLRPDYVVLRPIEIKSGIYQYYTVVKEFDAGGTIAEHSFLPGRGYLNFDSHFIIFAKKL